MQQNTAHLARQILAKMTLKEKVNELRGKGILKAAWGLLWYGHPLAVRIGGSRQHNLMPVLFTDGPRGVSVARATNFPVAMARGASWDVDLERRIGEVMGIEARAAGANCLGAVCVNLLRHPAWGRAQETYGEDSWHVGTMASALIKGILQHHVMPCVKHFALNSIENSRFLIDVQADERTLREVYLPHFKKCIDAGAMVVMSAYNRFRGEYCSQNRYLLTDILRKEWGFCGLVISDWFWGVHNTEKSIQAGMNVEMPGANYYTYKKIKKALDSKKVTPEELDQLVLPVVATKLAWQQKKDKIQYSKRLIACQQHISLAREAAEKSAVLLKNDNQFLPLQLDRIKKILVVGSLAKYANDGDNASSRVKSNYVITPYEGLKNYSSGRLCIRYVPAHDLEGIKQQACDADAVVVAAGYDKHEEGEYIHLRGGRSQRGKSPLLARLGILSRGDRLSLHLPERDLNVIDAVTSVTDRVVVCLFGGAAIMMESWKDKVPAIMMHFYNGMEGGNALARLLFGEVNPSGKLPFTIPAHEQDLPFFDSYADQIVYNYYHGYTLFDKMQKKVTFPFGFGLSYTRFAYHNLQVFTPVVAAPDGVLRIAVEVINIGQVRGEEVVQAYVGFSRSSVDRPVKLLRGFQKISLHPGESCTVSFEINAAELAYYDPKVKNWMIEKMCYDIYVGGSSSEKDLLRSAFQVC